MRVAQRTARVLTVAALSVIVLALASCAPAPGDVDNAGFERLRSSGVRIVDVRTEAEYHGGYIEGAENVPMSELASAASAWDRSEPIAVYCATGERSAQAAEYLRSLGFEKVYNLKDGIIAWDGPMAKASNAGTPGAAPSASGLPVMYEFYTDW
jgi:rhodanese-related sulfurtransferase